MKKLLAILIAVTLCLSCVTFVTPEASAASSDEETQAGAVLNMMGAIQGEGGSSLGLENTLTRAQFCKIAVVVMGLSSKVSQYSGYTIYPDVLSSDWEAGYVNVAVRYAGIMSGYADGTFQPDETITYGQVITVLVRMLGYTDDEVGANWPYGHIDKAEEIGLTDGVSLSANDTITKGEMAVLFVNMLNTDVNGSSETYMETISGASVISDVFLVSANGETDSGASGAVEVAGAACAAYLPVNDVPDSLVGLYGSLVLNSAGKALTFVPTKTGTTVVSTVSSTTAGYITSADGTKITISSTTDFYYEDEQVSYEDVWIDIDGGMLVSAYYNEGGTAECVLVTSASSAADSVTIVTSSSYSVTASAAVYLNGTLATSSDIIQYDVIEYDADSNVYNVTRKCITGRYEDASPNLETPDTITVFGKEFSLLDSAAEALTDFDIGDQITLLLTSTNEVAEVLSVSEYSTSNYGVVTSLSSSSCSVQLANGITLSGTIDDDDDVYEGSFVKVYPTQAGYLNPVNITKTSGFMSLNLETETLGTKELSKVLTIYECVGDSSVIEITLDDIATTTVSYSHVDYVVYDSSGDVSILLLDDVTGDCYTYGFIENGSEEVGSGSFSASNNTTSIVNSNGTSDAVYGSTGLLTGKPAGIAYTGGGVLSGYVTLTKVTDISRYDFEEDDDGTIYVITDDGYIPVSDDVQVYIDSTETWTTLAKARTYSDDLTIYYDRTLTTGGQVRIIIAY